MFGVSIERVHSGRTYTYAGLCGVLPKRWLGAAGMGALMAFLMASFEAELLMSVDLGHGESGGQDPPHPAIIMS